MFRGLLIAEAPTANGIGDGTAPLQRCGSLASNELFAIGRITPETGYPYNSDPFAQDHSKGTSQRRPTRDQTAQRLPKASAADSWRENRQVTRSVTWWVNARDASRAV